MGTTPATVFNVGSISKTVTAWGVLKLVERGVISLDDPVERYLRRWHLPASTWSPDGVTIRRLLSHTAGLSLPSVHEYRPGEPTPSLIGTLSDSAEGVRQIAEAGSAYKYSGGGYEVLQLLIEDVSGKSFSQFMRDEIFLPLGMRSSTFDTAAIELRRIAVPYDSGRAIPRNHYVGLAAAGLYSTAEDLGRFVAASMRGAHGEPPGRGVISATSVAVMQSPAPGSGSGFGFYYGLGYNLFPLGNSFGPLKILGDGALVPGHMGQNTGWGAVIWMNPGTGDGFVMLTNHSSGYQAYRWALCDWVRWVSVPSFGYICNDREKQALGPMGAALYASETKHTAARLPFVDSLARTMSTDTTPGLAILVMRDGVVTHSTGYGLADLATRANITENTPFYLASISKQFTAFAVLRLADQGLLSLDDRLSRFIPELSGPAAQATIRQTLTHSSGIPDHYRFIQSWPALRHLNNADVLDTVRTKPLDFPSGSSSKYSNSGYVLLSTVVERVRRRPFSVALADLVLRPAGMRETVSLDDSTPFPRGRAVGYDSSGGRLLVSDYGAFEAAAGRRGYIDMRTVGAGGMYSTLRDLAAWEQTLEKGGLLKRATLAEAFRVQQRADGEHGVDTVSGYGYGWIVSRRYGTDVLWHDGGFAGFHNIVLRVPSRKLMIAVLSNSAWIDHHRLAVTIADRLMMEPKPSEP